MVVCAIFGVELLSTRYFYVRRPERVFFHDQKQCSVCRSAERSDIFSVVVLLIWYSCACIRVRLVMVY